MKRIRVFTCIIGLLGLISHSLVGQNYIYLDQSFKEASVQMTAQRKGIGAIGKYEFGPYKVISGKAGWTTQKSKNWFISGDARIQAQTKSSFVFTGPNMDSATVNIAVSSVDEIKQNYRFLWRVLTDWSYLEQTGREVFLATYSVSSDTSLWNLVLAYPITEEIVYNAEITEDMISNFKGMMANSETTIEILPVFRWENGKPATVLKPVEGYTFVLQGKTVAAVQVHPANKIFVWLKEDLPENLKFILASGAATMLVRSL